MADKRISQLTDRGTVANNDVLPIVVSGAVTTNKATISSIQTFMQGNLDLGVTSVGITLGSSGTDVSVTGSPITTSGNITINIPTASAANRGVLSAADFITFNSKQGAITLTTTGTSGAATLVSNTLNIPNYAQDLSGFVTLNTAQTITAQKSFGTSGGIDSVIISTTGSGFALDAIKAGNGPVIRVNKTSGTGNAMTVIGGNFEAPTIVKTGGTSSQYLMADGSVSTLTNPITGTLATGQVAFGTAANTVGGSNNLFYDNANIKLGIGTNTPEATGLTIAGGGIIVSLDSTAARKVLELYATSTGAKVSSTYVGASSYGSLELLTSNIPRLTISALGVTTLTGALNGTSAVFSGAASSSQFIANGNSAGGFEGLRIINASTGAAQIALNNSAQSFILNTRTDNQFSIFNATNATTPFLINQTTGAATFTGALNGTSAVFSGGVNLATTSGNVGIGTATPDSKLRVEQSSLLQTAIFRNLNTSFAADSVLIFNARETTNSSYNHLSCTNGNFTGIFIVRDSGNAVNTNNSYGALSDIKLKEHIEDATPKLDDLLKVKVRNYNLIGDNRKQIGVIAQELEEVFPAMIDESEDFEEVKVPKLDEEGNEVLNEEGELVTEKQRVSKGTFTKSVKYSVFVPILIKAIQELKTEIDSLKNQIQ